MPPTTRNFLLSPLFKDASRLSPKAPKAPTFESLVGPKGWQNLPLPVRERFAAAPDKGMTLTYSGEMTKMKRTWLGVFFGLLCIPLGRPLPLGAGNNIPSKVKIYQAPGGRGVMWERRYDYPGRPPTLVKSIKKLDSRHGLLEYTGAGLGMYLNVYEQDQKLFFKSTGYFIQFGKKFIRIPTALTPGVALVSHTDLGAGNFEFSLIFQHPWFGLLFEQTGIFHLEGEAS